MDDFGLHGRILTRKRPSPVKKTSTKHNKQRKKPVKVVYISNPMRVSTSASSFRDLVQRLTGQDSELPDEPFGFDVGPGSFSYDSVLDHDPVSDKGLRQGHHDHQGGITVRKAGGPTDEVPGFGELGEEEGFINPRMLESLSEFLPPSLFMEPSSPHWPRGTVINFNHGN